MIQGARGIEESHPWTYMEENSILSWVCRIMEKVERANVARVIRLSNLYVCGIEWDAGHQRFPEVLMLIELMVSVEPLIEPVSPPLKAGVENYL